MSIALTPALLEYSADGTPCSSQYGDIYHTRSGGLAQAQAVFLAGNRLPERWQNRESFTLLETGFGLGLNFLATWQAWQNDPHRSQRLHFISVEKHPFSRDDLARAHADWPELGVLANELHAQWPLLVPGFHRLFLDQGRVILTLIFGDATQALRQVEAAVDAFYLDGFSPAKNPDLWTPEIARALGRVAAPGATLATWSVAGHVRQSLTDAGFEVSKSPGFGSKRNCLTGTFRHRRPVRYTPPVERTALVIGAGIAGTSAAERLASRGWQVTVLEADTEAGLHASGNLAGVLRPLPSADDNRLARLTRAGFLAVRQHVQRLTAAGLPIRWDACGVVHLAQTAEQAATQQRAVKNLAAPPEFLQFLDADAATRQLGYPCAHGGWFFPLGGWVQPPTVCQANLRAHPEHITLRCNTPVTTLQPTADGRWQARDAAHRVLAEAAIVVMAAGTGTTAITPFQALPQKAVRGQVSHLPAELLPHPLPHLVCGHGYIAPAIHGQHVLGATTVADDLSPELRATEHAENLARLQTLLPGCLNPSNVPNLNTLAGRVGFRPASPDRLPIVGPMIDFSQTPGPRPATRPGLWCMQGFGARGIVWSALMAELLVSQIMAEPLPLSNDLVRAVQPSRLLGKPTPEVECDNMSQV